MLPSTENLARDFTVASQPSKTYRMKIEDERVDGRLDGLEAVEQACYKILNTERYQYVIYSWNYGVELQSLFGKPIPYVFAELPRRIAEALRQDDRVEDVKNFDLSHNKGDVLAKFEVVAKRGTIQMEKGVTIL